MRAYDKCVTKYERFLKCLTVPSESLSTSSGLSPHPHTNLDVLMDISQTENLILISFVKGTKYLSV